MADRNVLIDNFGSLGLTLSDEVADKCVELCDRYNLDETELFEMWMAMTVTSGEDTIPTIDKLCTMERKELMKNTPVGNKKTRNVYQKISETFLPESEMKPMFGLEYPETKNYPPTPEVLRRGNVAQSPGMGFSPSVLPREASEGYKKRTNSGHVVCNYGDNVDSLVWGTASHFLSHFEYGEEFEPMKDTARYMFSRLLDKITSSRKQSDLICLDIVKNNGVKLPLEIHHISMETATYSGKVICDSRGKLNSSSILLETCLHNKRGENVRLQVTDLPEYSLFPGQVLVVEGKNLDGTNIIAEKIYTDATPKMYPPFKCPNLKEPMQIVVACGPYMLTNGSYQPFYDLMDYAVKHKPHVLILIGPIVDINHPDIRGLVMTERFTDTYKKMVDAAMTSLKGTHTKLILTSSHKEACHHVVYPNPPSPVTIQHPDLFMAPDPCIINISGFHVGLTASDIIMHLGKEELFCSTIGTGSQRLSRLASHLFQQKCFYPLKPPNEDMCVDPALLLDHAQIPFKPHVMVLPSDLRCFVNVISDSVFVNPEKLTKGASGGTFARIQVKPAVDDEEWSPSTHVSVQIVKI